MTLKKDNIAQIIFKRIQGTCTEEEYDLLDRWSKADPKNEVLLNKILDTKNVQQRLRILNSFDEDMAWQHIASRTGLPAVVEATSSRFFLTKRILIAASILLFIGVSIILYINLSVDHKNENSPRIVASANPKYKNDILPAIEGATLLLANGEKVVLSGDVTIEDNGNVLNAANNTIAELPRSEEVVYHELVVPQTHFFSFRLSDGTKVWVNANSKLRFPTHFMGDSRQVYLTEGEAYFEVERNESQPFIVETSKGKIKVLGTKFNIKNYQGDFVTTLAEGKVQVYNDNNSLELLPRQKSIVRGDKLFVRDADLTKDLAWKNNIFFFKNDNLKNVMQQIENWYGVQVVVDKSLMNSTTYSGEIARDVPLSEILNMLEFTSGLDFYLEETKLYIRPKK